MTDIMVATKSECFQCGKGFDHSPIQVGHMHFCSNGCKEIEQIDRQVNDIDAQISELCQQVKSLREDRESKLIEKESYREGQDD